VIVFRKVDTEIGRETAPQVFGKAKETPAETLTPIKGIFLHRSLFFFCIIVPRRLGLLFREVMLHFFRVFSSVCAIFPGMS